MVRRLLLLLALAAVSVVGLSGCGRLALDRLPSWLAPDYSNVVPTSPDARGVSEEILQKVSNRLADAGRSHEIVVDGDRLQTACWDWPFPQAGLASPAAADAVVEEIRGLLAGDPVIAYKSIRWRGPSDTVAERLVVCPSTDQMDILRFEQTAAITYGMYNEDITADIEKVDTHYQVNIVGASPESVELVMRNPPSGDEASAFGLWLYRLCPDLGRAPTSFPDGRIALWWQ